MTSTTLHRYPAGHPQAGKIIVDEQDLLTLLDVIEDETTAQVDEQPAHPAAAKPTQAPRALADFLPKLDQPAATAQPAPEPLSPQAKVQTAFVALFVLIALVAATQFLQPRSTATPATLPTATLAAAPAAVAPTTAPVLTVLAYAAPDGAQIGPVSLAALPAPIGRYGTSDWLYFEFAPPTGAVWLKASELGMQVNPTLKDMKPAPYNPPAAPAWTEPVAESAPAEAAPVERPDLHAQPTVDIPPTPVPPRAFQDEVAGAVLDPIGAAENGIKKALNPGNGCLKNKATGETICS